MAAIEKIRRHSGLLIAIIGLALLAFVLQDLFQSQGRSTGPTVAVVDGDKIPVRDYEQLKEKNLESRRSSSNTNNLSSAETYSIYNNTLEQMIKDNLMGKEYEAAGIGVTSEELLDQMTGENPHPWIVQSFGDGNGNFDRERVNEYLQNLNNLPAEYYDRWIEFERELKANRLETKFDNLVKASYFLPTALAEKYYEIKNRKASADVIALRYTTIPDSTVVVTDADNKAFYEENKYRYETDERRDIEYVVFDIKPSLEDRQEALKYVQDMRNDFQATDNVINFVNANSDQRYDSTWVGKNDVSESVQKAVFENGNGVGYVYGPYESEDAFNLVRIVDMQNRPDSLMASHILIPFKGAYNSQDTISKEDAEAKANELLAQLKSDPKNEELFAELAKANSTDPGSKDKGGDLGWFTDGAMVPTFNDFVVNNPVGTMGVVESPYGYHIIKVTDKTQPQPKARLAYLTHEIISSTKTYQSIYAEANKFVTENRTYDQFNNAIEAQGLTKRSMPKMSKSTYQIAGIDNPREIVRWAFDEKTKKGDVSEKIFELDNMLVVAALTGVIHEGYAPMDAVIEQAKYQILNKKKGELAVEKLALGADLRLGEEYLENLDFDVIFRTPGLMPFEEHLERARQRGSIVTSEMEVFFQTCPCRVIAVTGSDGKTTTTTIISELLKAAGFTVHLGGNIGKPLLCETPQMKAEDVAVLELSSFQLHSMLCRPSVSVITNISPNHLDKHKDFEDYVDAKKSIYRHQKASDVLVLNADDGRTPEFAAEAHSQIRLFSTGREVTDGVFCRDGMVLRARQGQVTPILKSDEILLPGVHNLMNYMAAFAATEGYVPDEICRRVAMSFRGVEHRLETVRVRRGVTYINDSIGTSPTRTIAGLHALKTKPIVIAGGYDKHIPFDTLGDELCQNAKAVLVTGATADRIAQAVKASPYFASSGLILKKIDGFDAAVMTASEMAEEGDIVLLSPACAAFDAFKNFAERGRHFKKLIMELEE